MAAALTPPANLYTLFEGTAGRQTLIRVNKNPFDGRFTRCDRDPRPQRRWSSRASMDRRQSSNGRQAFRWSLGLRLATQHRWTGYTYFTRYYYAQQHKEGAIIDERYNQGGQVADYIVSELDRKLMGFLPSEMVSLRLHLPPEFMDRR